MRLAERKRVELGGKLADLCAEFDLWTAEAEKAGPLRKHRSQIDRLTDHLRGMVDRIAADVEELPGGGPEQAGGQPGDTTLREARRLQLEILEVHRLWDYFRAKLMLRRIELFRPYLAAVDEFAWECAKPALERHGRGPAAQRESPLVFLSGDFSPFIHLRHQPFAVEQVPDALDTLEFLQLTYALPVPVIGVPWYQVGHLPDAIVIAHEVGHSVERDLELTSTTEAHLRAVAAALPGPRRGGWFAWLPEIFADLYATLVAGPAFASGLADLLATDPMSVAAERPGPPWADHPPAALRVALVGRALDRSGFAEEARVRRAEWAAAYPTTATAGYGGFFEDVEVVVDALLDGAYPQFGDVPLTAVVSFSPKQQSRALADAELVSRNGDPTSDDIRCLMASARIAFERDPVRYRTAVPERLTSHELYTARMNDVINDAVRFVAGGGRPAPSADRVAGAALIDLIDDLKRRRAGTPREDRDDQAG